MEDNIQPAPWPLATQFPNPDSDPKKKEPIQAVSSSYTAQTEPAHRRRGQQWLRYLKYWIGLGPQAGVHASLTQRRTPPPPPADSDADSVWSKIWTFFKFLGPGAIVSVAYVDPDNYQTAIASGGSFQYKLLFMVLVSNVIAIYIQSLCIKLGTVTGKDLAQLNHQYLPRWLELALYAIAEASIIATDLGQVIGQAIALNILIPSLPLPAACVLSVADVLLILLVYNPAGELRRVRVFEALVGLLVAAVFISLCVLLAMVSPPPSEAGPVFRGFVPSREVFVDTGLYEMCAILGGTLMPHALYVGTALSRARLHDFDAKDSTSTLSSTTTTTSSSTASSYHPSLRAIRHCLRYSIAELCVTLFTVAVFVNAALVIIAGAAFYRPPSSSSSQTGETGGGEDAAEEIPDDLYALHDLFSTTLSPAAGTLFAVSLLISGAAAGIVSTVAGQLVMEGAFSLRISPFLRRLATRCAAAIPALAIALGVGREGLSKALIGCNYLLAIALVPITFPLVWYTGKSGCMSVVVSPVEGDEEASGEGRGAGQQTGDRERVVDLKNSWLTAGVAWLLWLLVAVMDVATIVLVGLGLTEPDG